MRDAKLTTYARQNRTGMTESETLLWTYIRGSKLGIKFRRQQPVSHYILDFYCPERRVAVELDGSSHDGVEAFDADRDAVLTGENILVLRFQNEEMLVDGANVIAAIKAACDARPIYRY